MRWFSNTFECMKKNVFRLIITVNSIILLGIFFTQIYWVREAYLLMEDQFSGSVRIAMKGVANQMLNYQLKIDKNRLSEDLNSQLPDKPDIHQISHSLLKFKINEEFSCMHIGENYEYAIIELRDSSFIAGHYNKYQKELISSRHQIPMIGFNESEHFVLSAYFPGEYNIIFQRMIAWLVVSIIFGVLFVLAFYYTLYLFYRQKRLSEMKTDFINNMTHEFKTPLATISLASEMLMNKTVQEDKAKLKRYAKIIFDENSRLQNQVEQILSVAALEKGRFHLKMSEFDVNEVISKIVENFELTIKERNGILKSHYCAKHSRVVADKDHVTNVILNLIDNANKYSPENPWIRIGTNSTDEGIIISVEDKGIGISPENQHMIFRNLYRVSTGNLYNFKGFGIGLYYVKTIIEAHGGHINLTSELNKGSRFDVFLPFQFKSDQDGHSNQTKNSSG